MKFSGAVILLLGGCEAFAPSSSKFGSIPRAASASARSLAVDPSHLLDAFSSLPIADLADSVDLPAAAGAVASVDPAPVVEAAGEVAKTDSGWFGFLTGPIEGLLQIIHSSLVAVGLNNDAWGVSIIAMTLVIKLATFPLTKSQLESTNKMQVRLAQILFGIK